jgi:glycosyltransferase involved in cell wall biosynthesis
MALRDGESVKPTIPNKDRSLLVGIPCLNEENTIARVIEGIPDQIDGIDRIDILVIDDGSDDRSAERAREAGADVVVHRTNMGLGATFKEMMKIAASRGIEVLVHIDGDGQFDPSDISTLVRPIVEGQAEMVTASRFVERELQPSMPAVKIWGNRRIAGIVRLLTGKRFHDVSCGFRAYSREALLRMNLFGSFTYTQEVFLDLVFKELEILEVPVKVRGTREFGSSRIASSLTRYAFRSLQIMLRAFISYRPFSFFSVLAGVFLTIGFGFLGFLGLHYLQAHAFSPHIWAGFVGGSLVFLGILTLVIGLVGDMLVRIRMNQEIILYYLKEGDWQEAGNRQVARRALEGLQRVER